MEKLALLSVSERRGLSELARALVESGFRVVATSGTGKALSEEGIPFLPIDELTGQPEILDGRVKTLHPRIHAGLLAKWDKESHRADLAAQGISPFELAVVNLYPFQAGLASDKLYDVQKMIELVDIGGPAMIRAAAKNFASVVPVISPDDYPRIIEWVRSKGSLRDFPLAERLELARRVFAQIAAYDVAIARYFGQITSDGEGAPAFSGEPFGTLEGFMLERAQSLRYGENPHQRAGFYRMLGECGMPYEQLGGRELSYNNILDTDAVFQFVCALGTERPAAVIVKHANPCGAATGATILEALQRAKRGDPRSHFGGVIAFNREVDEAVAESVSEDFAEIVVAPGFAPAALAILRKKKNLRLLKMAINTFPVRWECRSALAGVLFQERDLVVSDVRRAECRTSAKPSASEMQDLAFAWALVSGVRSNAILIAKDEMILAVGAGQMSRIDSVEVALAKCKVHGHDVTGSVVASDAFFPFPDSVEALAAAGVRAIVAPAGAKRDSDVIQAADAAGIALVHVEDRHFRH